MASPSRTFPYLPPEIITEILRDRRLRNADLSSCCRVNRTWLDLARKSLYHTLDIALPYHAALSPNSVFAHTTDQEEVSHTLDPSSAELLSTLLSNSHIGRVVNSMSFKFGDVETTLGDTLIYVRPADILATFARLCPNLKAVEVAESQWLFKCYQATSLFRRIKLEQLTLSDVTSKDWEELRHFPSLKELECDDVVLDPTTSDEVPSLSLASLKLLDCSTATFDFVRSSASHSLRNLEVPFTVLPVLRLSHFPQLEKLSLRATISCWPVDSQGFLEDLPRTTSMRILELEEGVHETFGERRHDLGRAFPRSCDRVNLTGFRSLDALASVTQGSEAGQVIRQVGLSQSAWDLQDRLSRQYVSAARTLLSEGNIELIWID